MKPPPLSSRRDNVSGFTLIEVAISVGILAVSLVALLGLLPGGMTNFRKAMDISVTAQIAQKILQDMQQAEFNELVDLENLPKDPQDPTSYCKPHFSFRAPKVKPTGRALRYFDEQGAEVIPAGTSGPLSDAEKLVVVYHVNTRIIPRAELPTVNDIGGQIAQVTIQVARNSGNRDIPITQGKADDPDSPDRNLFKAPAGISIYTYYALIGKNQGS